MKRIFCIKNLRWHLILLLALCYTMSYAQDEAEYKWDIGGGVGMVSYIGDFNGNPFANPQPAASIVLRRVWNPYTALKMSVTAGKIKGKYNISDTYYPNYSTPGYQFNHGLWDAGAVFEYNFKPFGTGRDYRGTKRLAPYIYGGLGATVVTGGEKIEATANIPLGIGAKYKLGERLNIIASWGVHFSMSDLLDGVKDPYIVETTGFLKNRDAYTMLSVTLTYSFAPKCTTCNKD